MKLICVKTTSVLDGFTSYKIADRGWRGLYNTFVIWLAVRLAHKERIQ